MKRFISTGMLCLALTFANHTQAQEKLTLDNIQSISLRNSGTILSGGEVKGYFYFYISDKIDKHTNEYTIQVLDESLKLLKKITFTGDSKEQLLETSFNGNSLMFMFYNEDTKTVTNKIYGLEGKVKYTYTKELDKKSSNYLKSGMSTAMNEDGQNSYLYDIENRGYVSLIPQRDGKDYSYEVSIYMSDIRKQFTYTPNSEIKFEQASFLGATDSLLIFEVLRKNRMMSKNFESSLLAISLINGKKVFETPTQTQEYQYLPISISTLQGSNDFLVLGTYYEKDDNVMKDKTLGISAVVLDSKGNVTAKKYNSWEKDFSKFLNVNQKGKIDDIGYLYFHKIIQTEDGNIFAVGEGYRKTANAGGIALNVALAMAGGVSTGNYTKLTITDMVMIQLNKQFGITNVQVYEKNKNTTSLGGTADYMSPHMLAAAAKAAGSYDYEFTQSDKFHTNFYVGYSDYERSKDYKGQTFHTISYNGGRVTTDKITLSSKATSTRIMPAKTGFVMVSDYYKKDKRLDLHLEKIN